MDGYYLGPGTHIYVKTFPESLRSLYKQFFPLRNHTSYIIR